MARKVKIRQFRSVEDWDTRYGKSIRIVTRDQYGRLVDQVSLGSVLSVL